MSPLNALEEKLKLLQQKEAMTAAALDTARLKKEREDKLREEQRQRFEEEKDRKKKEKEQKKLEKERVRNSLSNRKFFLKKHKIDSWNSDQQEREKLKEEKKKYAERLKRMNQPREDMDCEDLRVSKRITAQADMLVNWILPENHQHKY